MFSDWVMVSMSIAMVIDCGEVVGERGEDDGEVGARDAVVWWWPIGLEMVAWQG